MSGLLRRWFRAPSLEVHVPISPTPKFLNMVHYLTHSLRRFGGAYRNARVIVTIGDGVIDHDLERRHPWMARQGVEVRWLELEKFHRDSFYATAVDRFCQQFESDMVLMLDADVLIRRPLDDLMRLCRSCFGGVIAHTPPFPQQATWQAVYDTVGLGRVRTPHEHGGWGYFYGDPERRYCPPYFNFGVLCGPADLMGQIGERIYPLMHKVNGVVETIFRCQLAVSLAITEQRIPYRCLPMRYNYPNCPPIEALHGIELPHAVLLHMLWNNQELYKDSIFDDPSHVDAMIARPDLRNINEQARRILSTIQPRVRAEMQEALHASGARAA